jgi:FHA domain
MATCTGGHQTAATDFCDICGLRVSAPPATAPAALTARGRHAAPAGNGGSASLGPAASPPPGGTAAGAPAAWTAVATADPAYFDRVRSAGRNDPAVIEFPGYCPPRLFPLTGREVWIGRRSVSRGIAPEIDLTGPPTDPGISHLHAVLTAEPDGSWMLVDPGSINGTQLNGAAIATGRPVPLHLGDRICIGAWTALTIQVS